MKKTTIIILLSILYAPYLIGQNTVNLSGSVVEKSTGQPLEYATVLILNPIDSQLITGAITNSKGQFNIETEVGMVHLKIKFIGYNNLLLENINISKSHLLPPIELKLNTEQADEVEITAEKSTIEYRLDKRVFNVGKNLISKGGSANDLLNNVPSVNVSIQGDVSLRGNPSVRILINGKPSVLTNGLDQIPAENIEKVEVITNPSAKYDAEGTAGIINIVLKKNKDGGFSSSLQLTTGFPANHSINYNLNYKTKKFNLFSNFRYSYLDFIGNGNVYRTNYNSNGISSILDEAITMARNRKVFNVYIGGDYYFNDKNTLTLSYYYRNNLSTNHIQYNFNFLNDLELKDSLKLAIENYTEPQKANQIELDYTKDFDKKGQKLTLNLQYDFWNDDENAAITRSNILPSIQQVSKLVSRDIESSQDFLFQSDFSLPISKKSNFEIGLKGEIRQINSDYEVREDEILVDSLDNLLAYHERIYGAYVQYGNKQKKFQYLLGLRAEHSRTRSDDLKDQFTNNKVYTNLFPTAHLTYRFNDKSSLQLSYSKRIRRPRFWQINPFGGIADQQNIRVGNPDLNPMYTHSFEIGGLKRWPKFTINPSIYYQHTINLFETMFMPNENGIIISKSINSGTENRLGLEVVTNYSPFKWWRVSGEINYFGFNQTGLYNVNDQAWFARINSRFKFSKFSAQASFNYSSARQSAQTYTRSIYSADIGLSQDLLKDKITITFNVNNIFDSRIRRQTISGTDYTIIQYTKWSGRRYSMTLTYRFNRKKSDRDRLPD